MTPTWPQNDPRMTSTWSQNDATMISTWYQHDPKLIIKLSPNDPRMIPKPYNMIIKSSKMGLKCIISIHSRQFWWPSAMDLEHDFIKFDPGFVENRQFWSPGYIAGPRSPRRLKTGSSTWSWKCQLMGPKDQQIKKWKLAFASNFRELPKSSQNLKSWTRNKVA